MGLSSELRTVLIFNYLLILLFVNSILFCNKPFQQQYAEENASVCMFKEILSSSFNFMKYFWQLLSTLKHSDITNHMTTRRYKSEKH
jgi:CRISPR/Cas system CSM-associated protein Csm4 (group 5 of RAMP superfamily)